jgi:hypothetical protein
MQALLEDSVKCSICAIPSLFKHVRRHIKQQIAPQLDHSNLPSCNHIAQMDVLELMSRKVEHERFKEMVKAGAIQGHDYRHDDTCRCQVPWPVREVGYRPALEATWELANQNPVDSVVQKQAAEPQEDQFRNSDLVIAIELGTTHTRVAYVYDDMRLTSNRGCIECWPGSDHYCSSVPTLLANNTQPPRWGASVEPTDQPQISHFTLGLQDHTCWDHAASAPSDLPSTHLRWKHPDLLGKTAVDYSAEFLSCINNFLPQTMFPALFGSVFLLSQRISYVITIPTDSSDSAKERTRQAAVNAGIPRNGLSLVSEHEAAAFYCATACKEVGFIVGSLLLVCYISENTLVSPHYNSSSLQPAESH